MSDAVNYLEAGSDVFEKWQTRFDQDYVYHAPTPEQVERYQRLRDQAKAYAWAIAEMVPPSREQSLALTNLEQAMMWANAAIARNEA